jgi:hypothetical protein
VGVPILLFGVAFPTWPDGWAELWPAWLSPTALGFLVALAVTAWLCGLILARLSREA